jgi:hypothetical protein
MSSVIEASLQAKPPGGQENIKRTSPSRKETVMPLRNKSNMQTLDPSLVKSQEKQ